MEAPGSFKASVNIYQTTLPSHPIRRQSTYRCSWTLVTCLRHRSRRHRTKFLSLKWCLLVFWQLCESLGLACIVLLQLLLKGDFVTTIFCVLLTVHLCIILEMKPTWCTVYSHYISSILFITSTCLGPLQVHQQEEQLYSCNTWYLLFCIAVCLVCRSIRSCTPDRQLYRIASTKCRINTVVPPDDGLGEDRNM
jgi:hypothetical protein